MNEVLIALINNPRATTLIFILLVIPHILAGGFCWKLFEGYQQNNTQMVVAINELRDKIYCAPAKIKIQNDRVAENTEVNGGNG